MTTYIGIYQELEELIMLIKVNQISKTALSANDGTKLRNRICDALDTDSRVELDFSGINLYATMFFNAFVGYFIMNSQKDVIDNKIELLNISELGEKTFRHSYDNAIYVKENNINVETAMNESMHKEE